LEREKPVVADSLQVGYGSGEKKELYVCGDLEGHYAEGSFYILVSISHNSPLHGDGVLTLLKDFARLFPPEAPSLRAPPSEKRAFLYKLLRPELVLSNPVPLSSDSFTMWGSADPNFRQYNTDVRNCTIRLYNETIPAFAAKLDKVRRASFVPSCGPEKRRISSHFQEPPTSPVMLITDMHREGINVRHLGRLRKHVESRELKNLLLVEMAAR
jgi:hypothetical protein